jgi:hypothetical protein
MKSTIPAECFREFLKSYADVKEQERAAVRSSREYYMGKSFGLVEGLATLSGINWHEAIELIKAAE